MNIRSQIDPSQPKVSTYPPAYVGQRPTVSAYLDSLAADYRRAFDVQVPECLSLSLAVSAFIRDVHKATGGRISRIAAQRLILGL